MAIIGTGVTPSPRIFGYSTISGASLALTNAPRGEVIFGETAAINGTGVADSQFVAVNMNLPANFAYVLVDVFVALAAIDAEDWEDTVMMVVNMAPPSAQAAEVAWIPLSAAPIHDHGGSFKVKAYSAPSLPRGLLIPASNPNISLNISNLNLNGAAATLRFWVRLLQYDVGQHHEVAVNTPMLTR